MTWLSLALAGLAAWRVAVLLVEDDGPFEAIRRLRAALWRDGNPLPLASVLHCVGCTSVWTAAGAYAWLRLDAPTWPLAVAAVAGLALMLERLSRSI